MSEKWPVSEALGLRRLLERAGGSPYRVRVRNLLLPCSIGIHDHERRRTQRVRINVELDVTDPGPFSSEDFSQVLNYETIVSGVREIVGGGHIELVETLAERIAAMCLADPRSVSVTVGVEKLDVYSEAESVGVSVMRQRGAWPA
jgi:7,8-dihydroneopterin aldolase/epimerase/oxygenase